MKKAYLLTAIMACVFAAARAQRPEGQTVQKRSGPQDEDVLRISVTLVQVDAVVTGKDGREVTDLRAEDFEVLEDGRPRRISNFSYISTAPDAPVAPAPRVDRKSLPAPLVPAARLRPEQVKRTIVFVIDTVSFQSLHDTRKALGSFVDKEMRDGDLVAIIYTGQGANVFQQFTTDRRLLHMAIDGLRWMPSELYGTGAMASAEDGGEEERFYEENHLRGKLGALSLIVRGLEPLPGRKTVFLFSDHFPLFGKDMDNERTEREMRIVTGQANRSLVVFNTVDTRGLQVLNVTASERITPDRNGTIFGEIYRNRWARFINEQDGMDRLAKGTGGRFVHNVNAGFGVTGMLNKEMGYYLLGYTLDEKSLSSGTARRSFHKLEVRVKRPGLRVRSRREFYGVPYREAAPRNNTPGQKLLAALTSPFHQGDVGLRLTSLFGHDAKEGSFVRSLVHVDARDLTFAEEADGWRKASVRLLAVAYDENGLVGKPVAQGFALRARGDGLERLRRDGAVYEMTVPVRRAGIYQVRVAVQDVANERVGAANQLIEVPDVNAGRLAISGLVLSGADPSKAGESAAVRRLPRGGRLNYAFIVYNARTDEATGGQQLEARLAVYHDGVPIHTELLGLPGPKPSEPNRVVVNGTLNLGPEFTPSEYVLQVVVTDRLAKEKFRTATRWVDFDVVE